MKGCQFLLICMLAMLSTSADSLDTRPLPHYGSFAVNAATAGNSSAQIAVSAVRPRSPWTPRTTHADFADLSGVVVKDMRATSMFVQEQATKAGAPSGWLIALAAFGLVALQLRRKHKSLPQRRIVPYG